MFDRWKKEHTLLEQLHTLSIQKQQSTTSSAQKTIVTRQLHILDLLEKKSSGSDTILLKNVAQLLSGKDAESLRESILGLSKGQMRAMADSLKKNFDEIRSHLSQIKNLLLQQQQMFVQKTLAMLPEQQLNNEKTLIEQLFSFLKEEEPLQESLKKNLGFAKELDHTEFFVRAVQGISKIYMLSKYTVVVQGAKIPADGPVVIAPRHYHGDDDPIFIYQFLHRTPYIMGAVDWMREGLELSFRKDFFYKNLGVLPVDRPESIKEYLKKPKAHTLTSLVRFVRLLMLRQAIVIYPEGWPNIDKHFTIKQNDTEIIEARQGVLFIVNHAQKRMGERIPIYPVGCYYKDVRKLRLRHLLVVYIGEPMYIDTVEERFEYAPYQKHLIEQIRELSARAEEIANKHVS